MKKVIPNIKTISSLRFIALCTMIMLLGTTVSAQLIVYESFNYTLGITDPDPDGGANGGSGYPYTNSLNSSETGVGLKNRYNTDHTVVAGLTYSNSGGILVSANYANKRTAGTGNSLTAAAIYKLGNMSADPFQSYRAQSSADFMGWNNASGAKELYLSVLLNASAVNTGTKCGLIFNLGFNNVVNESAIKQSGANWVFQGIPGSGNEIILGTATANQTAFFVIKYSFLSATAFKAECWYNPVLGAALGTPTVTYNKTDLTSGADFRSILTQNGANVLSYDEFRLGVTAADVMPFTANPSTALSHVKNSDIKVYQSAKNQLTVAFESSKSVPNSIEIYDTKGMMVFNTNNAKQQQAIDLNYNGLYIVKLTGATSEYRKVLLK